MMSPRYESELVKGIADYLGATLDPDLYLFDDAYADDETRTVIMWSPMPTAPSLVLGVRYVLTLPLTPGIDFVESDIQIRARGDEDPNTALDMLGDVRAVLHEKAGIVLGNVRASAVFAGAVGYLGPDGSGRQEATQTYRVRSSGQVFEQ